MHILLFHALEVGRERGRLVAMRQDFPMRFSKQFWITRLHDRIRLNFASGRVLCARCIALALPALLKLWILVA